MQAIKSGTRAVGSVFPGVSKFSDRQRARVESVLKTNSEIEENNLIPKETRGIKTLAGTIADLSTRFTTPGAPEFKPTSEFKNYALSQAFQHHLTPAIQTLIKPAPNTDDIVKLAPLLIEIYKKIPLNSRTHVVNALNEDEIQLENVKNAIKGELVGGGSTRKHKKQNKSSSKLVRKSIFKSHRSTRRRV
jgi:hypothetical protein